MAHFSSTWVLIKAICTLCVVPLTIHSVSAQTLVPAVFTFGDSTVDVGNNNYLETVLKADFLPYGRDFDTHMPTGRFCDGRLATDYTAVQLGFTSFPPAYLSPQATGQALTTGVNFASGGSGFFESTAEHFNVIPMTKQLELFQEYKGRLAQVVGSTNASTIISGSIFVVSAGNSDFLLNYYVNLRLQSLYTATQFGEIILGLAGNFIQNLYSLGARRIAVVSLAPIGCLPLEITISLSSSGCVESLNQVASAYNTGLQKTVTDFAGSKSDLKIAYFDTYNGLLDIIQNAEANGFTETRRSCCGTGTFETAILCNKYSPGTCSNASQYVFFDSVHPSQAANQILANGLLSSGITLIG